MARLITSGFELKEGLASVASFPDGASQGALESTIVRSGSASRKWSGSPSQTPGSWTFTALTLGVDCFARTYLYVPTGGLPSAGQAILSLGPTGAFAAVRLEADGTLTLWALLGGTTWTQQGSASASIAFDSFENRVELKLNLGTGSVDAVDAKLNGISFASATGLAISDVQTNFVAAGAASATSAGGAGAPGSAAFTLYADDVAVNDGSGAAQNSWPDSGKVVLLKPTADSAVGTGWTKGNTTATGGAAWNNLDNGPPDSAADLTVTADSTQIRNATSNANVNYDATMTTYTAAGVPAGATVNVLMPFVATGAPVVTSAKAGTVGVVSNPAIANVSLGAGGTSGAFWSGVAMGTYPTGNKWSFGTTTYAPSVTLGTAPVMRVTQVTASTRIAIVTEMGIYVDYTPAVVVAARQPRNAAVNFQDPAVF